VTAALLETRGLCKSFGALEVARDVDFRLKRGARHALIGPNGAGKTTLVNLLTGLLAPSRGAVLLEGEDLPGADPVGDALPRAIDGHGHASTFLRDSARRARSRRRE